MAPAILWRTRYSVLQTGLVYTQHTIHSQVPCHDKLITIMFSFAWCFPESEQIRQALTRGLSNERPVLPPISGKQEGEDDRNLNRKPSIESETDTRSSVFELGVSRFLDGVHIRLNMEAAALLPLALRFVGRLEGSRVLLEFCDVFCCRYYSA